MNLLNSISKVKKANVFIRYFGIAKVAMFAFIRPKVVTFDDEKLEIVIPLCRKTRNHLKSMYFGVLCCGADIAGGLAAMSLIIESKQKVELAFKDFTAEFLKKAYDDVVFINEQGLELKEFVDKVLASEERMNMDVKINAYEKKSKLHVASFVLTLSLKKK